MKSLKRKARVAGKVVRMTDDSARRNFSKVLDQIEDGDTVVVERDGEPVCEMTPLRPKSFTMRDLADFLKTAPPLDDEVLDAIEETIRNQPMITPDSKPWEP